MNKYTTSQYMTFSELKDDTSIATITKLIWENIIQWVI